MEIIPKKIEELSLDPANARKHDEKNLEAIKGSLRRFGQQKPIVVSPTGVVLAGNGTLAAAKALGWETIGTVTTNLAGPDAMAYALADNRTAELAAWDMEILGAQLQSLYEHGDDIAEFGFDPDEFNIDLPDAKPPQSDEDEVPEVEQNVHGVERGDLWQLGRHRLLCGDSTNRTDVDRLMGGEKADIGFTSPPYNVGSSTRGNLYANDSDNKTDYVDFLNKFTNLGVENSKYLFVNIQALSANWVDVFTWQNCWLSHMKDVLIWNKSQCPPNIQKGSFNTKFEFVYVFTREESNGRNFPCSWQGKYPNVIDTTSNSSNEFADTHKAGFPVAFPLWIIEKMDFAKSVYEPFCGTGTTLVACEKTNRTCYGMEIDPHYCSVIIERWQNYTGEKAEKLV